MTAKTSDDYAACVRVFPNGKMQKVNCLRERILDKQAALEQLRQDFAAIVSYETYSEIVAERRN